MIRPGRKSTRASFTCGCRISQLLIDGVEDDRLIVRRMGPQMFGGSPGECDSKSHDASTRLPEDFSRFSVYEVTTGRSNERVQAGAGRGPTHRDEASVGDDQVIRNLLLAGSATIVAELWIAVEDDAPYPGINGL